MIDWSLVLGNPFWLGSIPFAFIGWLIAFIGQCVIDRNQTTWWYIFYFLFLLTGVLMVIITDSIRQYRIVVTAFMAVGITYGTAEISTSLPSSQFFPAYGAIAAGYIFMTVILFVWVFAFASSDDSYIFNQLNSYVIPAKANVPTLPIANNGIAGSQFSSQQGGIPMGALGSGYVGNAQPTAYVSPETNATSPLSETAEYSYKAKALYAYEASQDDPNELSFAKGEVLDIVDNKGKWWQARKSDGRVGIAPSNYLQIL